MKTNMNSSGANNLMNALSKLVVVAGAVVAIAGCGEAIDISHVGPNVVDKKIFDGEWYYKNTIVDKQATDAFDVVGEGGEVDRVRWEITENELIAHQSYERVPGSNPSNPGDDNVVDLPDHQALRHQARVQPHERCRDQLHRRERLRSSLVAARLHAR